MGDIISSKIKDPYGEDGESEGFFCLWSEIRAEHTMKRKADGPLYLETAGSTLRETSHLTSAPSSDLSLIHI